MKLVGYLRYVVERSTLPLVLEPVPTQVDGVGEIVALVVDGGASDAMVGVARAHEGYQLRVSREEEGPHALVPGRSQLRA